MKKVFIAILAFLFVFNTAFTAFAKDPKDAPIGPKGILPAVPEQLKGIDCESNLDAFFSKSKEDQSRLLQNTGDREWVLGCAVKTGRIKFWMMPFFLVSLVQFLIGLAGLICVLFIVIGGYKLVFGGISDDKESGKKTIIYAITGLVVSLLSWIVINVIQVQLTR